jgi:disulfide bond formation protein DsbB
LAGVGAVIAGYHYLIQHVPSLSTGACSTTVPCSAPWVWKFDFVSIPFMALVAFVAIIVLFAADRAERAATTSLESQTPITSPDPTQEPV